MEALTIGELVSRAREFVAEERTPFAETPWSSNSIVIWNEGDDTAPISKDGKVFDYFLEPSVIIELTETSKENTAELVNRVIQYAENDA